MPERSPRDASAHWFLYQPSHSHCTGSQPGASGYGESRDAQDQKKNYEREDIYDADYVIAATNDHQINSDIYSACKCMGITVNVCSDKTKCDFYFPGIVQNGNVVIGVTASGSDHKEARKTVEKIRSIFPEEELK